MRSRSAELRKRERRVLAWSLVAAAALHVAVFVLWRGYRVEPLTGSSDMRVGSGQTTGTAVYVEVVFGAPVILGPDGSRFPEPPERMLEAARVLRLPPECAGLGGDGALPVDGRVRLRVNARGRAEVLETLDSTGDACGDEVVRTVSDALWYRWLPSERFPAPVDVLQPVRLVLADG